MDSLPLGYPFRRPRDFWKNRWAQSGNNQAGRSFVRPHQKRPVCRKTNRVSGGSTSDCCERSWPQDNTKNHPGCVVIPRKSKNFKKRSTDNIRQKRTTSRHRPLDIPAQQSAGRSTDYSLEMRTRMKMRPGIVENRRTESGIIVAMPTPRQRVRRLTSKGGHGLRTWDWVHGMSNITGLRSQHNAIHCISCLCAMAVALGILRVTCANGSHNRGHFRSARNSDRLFHH